LIVGLGNPGSGYTGTRHNAGFWFVDALVSEFGGSFAADKRANGDLAQVSIAENTLRVLKPMTYMNDSGRAVRALLDFYKLEPVQVLVVHDDLDLEPGTVRLKRGGGHGGHNGLRDVSTHIGADYLRLRIGIGHPRDARGGEPVEWVLKRPSSEDERAIRDGIDSAVEIMPRLFEDKGVDRVMEILNRRA
jgi:PTH1 family peptidyl-tRNA hydrolase